MPSEQELLELQQRDPHGESQEYRDLRMTWSDGDLVKLPGQQAHIPTDAELDAKIKRRNEEYEREMANLRKWSQASRKAAGK